MNLHLLCTPMMLLFYGVSVPVFLPGCARATLVAVEVQYFGNYSHEGCSWYVLRKFTGTRISELQGCTISRFQHIAPD